MIRGFSYRLYPDCEQAELMARSAGCARFVYNAGLEQRSVAYELGHRVNWAAQDAELKDVKRAEELEFLGEVHSDVLVQALRDLDRAFGNFFAGRAGYPRPKRKHGSRASFRLQQRRSGPGMSIEVRRVTRRWGEVKLPKLGWVRFRWDRKPVGKIKHATISHDGRAWHVALCCNDSREAPTPRTEGSSIGIDRGVAASFATSDGNMHHVPLASPREQQRRRRLERRLARQKKGSARRERTKHQLARLRATDRRRRTDYLHKLTTQLADTHTLIALEDLNVRNMTASAKGTVSVPGVNVAQKAGLNRAILHQGWSQFKTFLEYKLHERGHTLVLVPAAYTSQTCSACGHTARENRETQAVFSCQSCGHTQHADTNAARNIHHQGLIAAGRAVTAHGALEHKPGNELRTTPSKAAARAAA